MNLLRSAALTRWKPALAPHWLLFPVLWLGGSWLRFYQIGKQPLWMDEAFSVWMGNHSPVEIVQITAAIDQHPPLYPLLLHLWMAVGGSSEAWVRMLSALMGALTIVAIYFLGKTLAGQTVGLLSALILAVSPFHIQYGQETRAYTMLALFACLTFWMTARLLTGRPDSPHRRLTWASYVLFTALALYGHNTAFFLPLGINLFVLGLMLYRRFCPAQPGQMRPPALKSWLLAQAAVFLIWCPWLPGMYRQWQGMLGEFWIPTPNLDTVLDALKSFLMANLPERIGWQGLIWAGFGVLILLALVRMRASAGHFLFLAALFLTPILGELLASLRQPIFLKHTLIWTSTPLYVMVALGISQLRHRSYMITASLILVTLSLLSLNNYFTYYEKERWDLAAAYVNDKVQAGDLILFNAGWAEIPFDYYFARYKHSNEEAGAPETMFENNVLEPRMTEADLPRLRALMQGRQRIWLVYTHNWWTDPGGLIPRALGQEYHRMDMKFFGGIQIHLYGNPSR